MSHSAEVWTLQTQQNLITNCGHHLMEDTVIKNATSANRYPTCERSNQVNATMEKSEKKEYSGIFAIVLIQTTSAILATIELKMDDVQWTWNTRSRRIRMG